MQSSILESSHTNFSSHQGQPANASNLPGPLQTYLTCPCSGRPFERPWLATDGNTYESGSQPPGWIFPPVLLYPNQPIQRMLLDLRSRCPPADPVGIVQSHTVCPITHDVYRVPVQVGDGHAYEAQAMRTWLQCHATSPMTRRHLSRPVILTGDATLGRVAAYAHDGQLPPPADSLVRMRRARTFVFAREIRVVWAAACAWLRPAFAVMLIASMLTAGAIAACACVAAMAFAGAFVHLVLEPLAFAIGLAMFGSLVGSCFLFLLCAAGLGALGNMLSRRGVGERAPAVAAQAAQIP